MNLFLHNTTLSLLCSTTRYSTLNFCFRDELIKTLLPCIIMMPLRTLESSGVLQEVYIHHLFDEKHSTPNISLMCLVPFKYFNALFRPPPVNLIQTYNYCGQKQNCNINAPPRPFNSE